MPVISVDLLAGRDPELLRRLLRSLSAAVVDTLGVPAESVDVVLHEVAAEHWMSGGRTKAEQRAAPARDA